MTLATVATPDTEQLPEDTRPGWVTEIVDKYRSLSGHAFLGYGIGVFDYVGGFGLLPRDYLAATLAPAFPTVVQYSPGPGFSWPDDSSRDSFIGTLVQASGQDADTIMANLSDCAPSVALPLILRFLTIAEKHSAVAIISRMDLCAPAMGAAQMAEGARGLLDVLHEMGTARALERSQNMLIMLSPTLEGVHSEVHDSTSGVKAIEIALPDRTERLVYIHQRIRTVNGMVQDEPLFALEMSEGELATMTAGMSRRNIEDVLLEAGPISKGGLVTRDTVQRLKAETILRESGGLLKIRPTRGGFDSVGGQAHVKTWQARWLIDAARSDDPEAREAMPFTMLYVGPPGTGKTSGADALAAELEWPCIEYGNQRDSLVGETQKNNSKAQAILRRMLPAVLVLDELDSDVQRVTGGGGSGSDSIEKDLFKARLTLLADTSLRGQLVIVGTSNQPDLIDGAMLSRFEYRVPILPPEDDTARTEVLVKMLARKGVAAKPSEVFAAAKLLDGWAGRDMEGVVTKAVGLMRLDKLDVKAAMHKSATTRKPLERSDTKAMTALAIAECNDLDLLPEKYRKQGETIDRKELDREVAQLRGRTGAGRELNI